MNIPKRNVYYLILTAIVVIALTLFIIFKGPMAPVKVSITQLSSGTLAPDLFGIGTIAAKRNFNIGPTRTGKLAQLFVDVGDHVQVGQLLGNMDAVDLPDRLKSAQLSIEKSEHLIEASVARFNEAKSRELLAQRENKRYHSLLKKHQISQESADAKATEARTTADQAQAAKADLDGAKHDLERLKYELKAIQSQLDELKLVSPVDGIVSARNSDPGSLIVSGTPVLQIIDNSTIWVRVRIEQRNTETLRVGLPADIFLRSMPEKELSGKVARLELIADSLTEERWVDVSFNQIPVTIALGILANVTIHLPPLENADWLPAATIQNYKRTTGVWLLQNGKAHFVKVNTGIHTLDGKVQILSGITKNDKVVLYSPVSLTENQKLETRHRD